MIAMLSLNSCSRFKVTLLALLLAGPVLAIPRVLPPTQAKHFCQLLVNDGDGSVYPLNIYARNFTTLLFGGKEYGKYTVEQVFTGFIFFYDDWVQEPLSSREGFELVNELHSGATLRIFPHLQGEDIIWYAPNSNIPEHVPSEHRRYMPDVFSRLNGEVQAGNWSTVDAYIDRMIQYQCQFGGEKVSVPVSSEFLVSISAFILVVFLVSRLLFVNLCRNKN